MTFTEYVGPDASRRTSAWGARTGATAPRRVRTGAEEAHSGPKIVTTPKKVGFYPTRWAAPFSGDESLPSPVATPAKKERRQAPHLASSTAKPKPREKPKPPIAGAWTGRPATATGVTPFRVFYDRGDLPVCIGHGAKRRVQWKCKPTDLDFHHYLPLFFEGLRETKEPYCFLAEAGVQDLVEQGPEKVLPVVPQLIQPLKKALNSKDKATLCRVLQVLQHLCKIPYVGEALVPYYRSLLPVFNLVLLLEKRSNLGDRIDYGQQKKSNLIDLINETLEVLEQTGGESAFVNIKYMVPAYESASTY